MRRCATERARTVFDGSHFESLIRKLYGFLSWILTVEGNISQNFVDRLWWNFPVDTFSDENTRRVMIHITHMSQADISGEGIHRNRALACVMVVFALLAREFRNPPRSSCNWHLVALFTRNPTWPSQWNANVMCHLLNVCTAALCNSTFSMSFSDQWIYFWGYCFVLESFSRSKAFWRSFSPQMATSQK